jgi:hypothetical protein
MGQSLVIVYTHDVPSIDTHVDRCNYHGIFTDGKELAMQPLFSSLDTVARGGADPLKLQRKTPLPHPQARYLNVIHVGCDFDPLCVYWYLESLCGVLLYRYRWDDNRRVDVTQTCVDASFMVRKMRDIVKDFRWWKLFIESLVAGRDAVFGRDRKVVKVAEHDSVNFTPTNPYSRQFATTLDNLYITFQSLGLCLSGFYNSSFHIFSSVGDGLRIL